MRRLPAIAALVGALLGCGENPPPPGDALADKPRAATGPPAAALAPDPIAGPSPPPTLPDALRPAVALIERGRFADAREIAEAYLRTHADDGRALFVKGLTFHRARDYAAAEPLFVRALAADPSFHVVHHFLGYCRFHLGNDLPGARAAFELRLSGDYLSAPTPSGVRKDIPAVFDPAERSSAPARSRMPRAEGAVQMTRTLH